MSTEGLAAALRSVEGTPASSGSNQYRPEIDGLRALAIVPVVVYHAGVSGFGGGYVGVDVFFVISGYLITSIILAEKSVGKFTMSGFYERRARRILPALFFLMIAGIPFAWFWMTPHHLKGYAQSMVATSVFLPNIYFFLKSSYFDIDADEKPLLHTWSLGVEEQYYLTFPLFVILAWRWGLIRFAWVVAIVALSSLGVSEWASRAYPVANFYLAPTRAWELSLGSLLAVFQALGVRSCLVPSMRRKLLEFAGIVLIVAPVFVYDHSTRFPGAWALPPTVGAALIICFADETTLIGRLLACTPVRAIGLISYSLYLWHQPVFAFARLYGTEALSPKLILALIVLSMALAFFSWRFIEQPLRDRRRFSRRRIFGLALAGSVFFVALGLAGHLADGFPNRLSPDQLEIFAFADDPATQSKAFPGKNCFLAPEQDASAFGPCTEGADAGGRVAYLWGDSHAAHLYSGLSKRLGSEYRLTTLTSGACPPLLNYGRSACRSINKFVLGKIALDQPDLVVIAAVWGNYEWREVERTIRQLKTAGVKQIRIVGPIPRWIPSLPVVLVRHKVRFSEIPQRISLGLDPNVRRLDAEMRVMAENEGVAYISPYSILCDVGGCLVRAGSNLESLLQWDVSHLTNSGSEYLVSRF